MRFNLWNISWPKASFRKNKSMLWAAVAEAATSSSSLGIKQYIFLWIEESMSKPFTWIDHSHKVNLAYLGYFSSHPPPSPHPPHSLWTSKLLSTCLCSSVYCTTRYIVCMYVYYWPWLHLCLEVYHEINVNTDIIFLFLCLPLLRPYIVSFITCLIMTSTRYSPKFSPCIVLHLHMFTPMLSASM